jgi:hypothetical protein
LQALCDDPRFVGGKIGALAVLHTWSRTLQWHPHIHMLVPGGGVAPDGRTWRAARNDSFLVPVRALAKLFRARFLARARDAFPNVKLSEVPWDKPWVVFAKPVVQGADKVLEYLGRYVHRTAITDKSIVANRTGAIGFAYRESLTNSRRRMTLPAHEFLRRFLQHVPPRRLHRVRSFGLLHPSHRVTLRRLQLLLGMRPPEADSDTPAKRARCTHCPNAALRMVRKLTVSECERQLRLGAIAIGAARGDAIARGPPTAPQPVAIAN